MGSMCTKTRFRVCDCPEARGAASERHPTLPTMIGELKALAHWLTEKGCTHVAMESPGVFEILVVNAAHLKKFGDKCHSWTKSLVNGLDLRRACDRCQANV